MLENAYIGGLIGDKEEFSSATNEYGQVKQTYEIDSNQNRIQMENYLLEAVGILFYRFTGIPDVKYAIEKDGERYLYETEVNGQDIIGEQKKTITKWEDLKDSIFTQEDSKIFLMRFEEENSDTTECESSYLHVLTVSWRKDCLELTSCVNTNSYTHEYINYFMEKMLLVLKACQENNGKEVRSLVLEKPHYPKKDIKNLENCSLVSLIEEACKKYAFDVALEEAGRTITYNELHLSSNIVAANISRLIKGDTKMIAIIGYGCMEYILSVIGCLKAGVTFLPFSEDKPIEKIKDALQTAHCRNIILLSDTKAEQWKDYNVIKKEDLFMYQFGGAEVELKENPLVYIIFTSGSTGKNKGVKCGIKSLCNYLIWARKEYCSEDKPIMPFFTEIDVDLTITSTFLPFISGGKLIVYSEKNKVKKLSMIVKENAVNLIKLTPSHLKLMLSMPHDKTRIKKMILGGEGLKKNLVDMTYQNISESVVLYNEYGPTEATIGCMCHKCNPAIDVKRNIALGNEITNCRIYILDPDGNNALKYGYGELYIGGLVLGEGYLGEEELTKKAFLENLIEGEPVLYKTDDIVRINGDGSVEYCGRRDEQIKIRGRRCSLNEIEDVVNKLDYIEDSLVLYNEEKELVYCFLVDKSGKLEEESVKQQLAESLPDYLIPSRIIFVEEIPLAVSGKKDINEMKFRMHMLLSFSEETKGQGESVTELEKELIEIWKEVLERDDFTTDSNFFQLGGHSLNVAELAGKIYTRLNVMVQLGDLFDMVTIKEQAKLIEREQAKEQYEIQKAEAKSYYKASYSQARMYIYSIMNKDSILYNTPSAFIIRGNIDLDRVKRCINEIIRRQGCLRTAFLYEKGMIVQKVYEDVEFSIDSGWVSAGEEEEIIDKYLKPFDLTRPPLMRMMIAKYREEEGKWLFIIDMHHIITDGASMYIFIQDFCKLYNGEVLEELELQYTDFSEWQNNLIQDGFFDRQKEYWKEVYKDNYQPLVLPVDEEVENTKRSGKYIRYKFSEELSERVSKYCIENNLTHHAVLFAAFTILLSEWCKTDQVIIGTATVGRVHEELYQIIGVFINMMPVRQVVSDQLTVEEFLSEVRSNVINSFENSDVPIDLIRNQLPDMGEGNLFDVTFTTQDFGNVSINDFHIQGMELEPLLFDTNLSHAKLNMVVAKTSPNIECIVEYYTNLFREETIKKLLSRCEAIVNWLLNNLTKKIGDMKNDVIEDRN